MNCPRPNCKNKAIQHAIFGVLPCKSCQNSTSPLAKHGEFSTLTKQERIQEQRDHHAKDIIQPWDGDKPNEDFVRAYPEYREQYFTPDQLKNI